MNIPLPTKRIMLFERIRRSIFRKSLGPVRYSLVAIGIAWLVGTAVSQALDSLFGYTDEPNASESVWSMAVLVLVMAPLIENFVTVSIVELLRRYGGVHWIAFAVLASATVAFATHAEFNLSHGLFAAIMFATMAFTYIDWRELRWRERYFLTVLQHALINFIPLIAFAFERTG